MRKFRLTGEYSMKVKQLINLKDCKLLYNIEKLNLIDSSNKMLEKTISLRESIKTSLLDGEPEEVCINKLSQYIDTYPVDWFVSIIVWNSTKEKDFALYSRLVTYLYSLKLNILEINKNYNIKTSMECNGTSIDYLSGMIDLLVEHPDGSKEAIIFKNETPTYSYSARIASNKVINSLELICMQLAINEPLKTSIYYLKGKDDKGDVLQGYEYRKGKNIVSCNFEESSEELLLRLKELCSGSEPKNCSTCHKKNLCKVDTTIKYPNMSHQVDVTKVTETIQPKASKLTAAQKAVVEHVNGPLSVLAVPGSGKTHSLVERMVYLVKTKHIQPANILFVTFTNKACNEIKKRVANKLGIDENDPNFPNIYTFNGLGNEILKEHPELIGKVRLAGDIERLTILLKALELSPSIPGISYTYLYGKFGTLKTVDRWITYIENNGKEKFIDAYQSKCDVDAVLYVYNIYKKEYKKQGYISYDEQITLVNLLFEKHPTLVNQYSSMFQHIMVDETQDVNVDQMKLITFLGKHQNVLAVADDDQNIYSWRGGSSEFILNYDHYFPNAKRIFMEDNFRSNDKVLDAANHLISGTNDRLEKQLIAHKSEKYKPIYIGEASKERVKYYLEKLLQTQRPSDIAILARTNKKLIELAEYLQPQIKVSSPKDYLKDDAVFLLFLSLFTIYYEGLEDNPIVLLGRIHGFTFEDFDKKDQNLSIYQNYLDEELIYPIILSEPDSYRAYKESTTLSKQGEFFMKIFDSLKSIQYASDFEALLLDILSIWGEQVDEHPVISALLKVADEHRIGSLAEMHEYMKQLILFDDATRIEYGVRDEYVNLLTCHDSKGKEFKNVLIYGTEDFELSDPEQRRLLYVAMTRAENNLLIFEGISQKEKLWTELKDVLVSRQ